jgi:hypothetical protein
MKLTDYLSFIDAPIDWAISTLWTLQLIDSKFRDPAFGGVTDLGALLGNPNSMEVIVPIETIEERIAAATDNQINMGHLFYRYPSERGMQKSLNISFYDDAKYRFSKMFQRWIDWSIPPSPMSAMKPLSAIQRKVILTRWDYDKKTPVWQRSYFVFPNGELSYQGTGTADLVRYQLELVVVREVVHK